LPIPRLRIPVHCFDGQHYWEINKQGYPLSKIISIFEKTGFIVIENYRIFDVPIHRFFILKKEFLSK
jgi:hypothetical protein